VYYLPCSSSYRKEKPVPVPPVDAGILKTIVSTLLKPFEIITTPIAERIAIWLKRKPNLHLFFHPRTCVWCVAHEGQKDGSQIPVMQVMCDVDLSHDDPREHIIVVRVFPEGTTPSIFYPIQVSIPPHTFLPHQRLVMFVTPVLAEKGKPWSGPLVIVDQHNRKYRTQRIAFQSAG
jgi:hypothetical protein